MSGSNLVPAEDSNFIAPIRRKRGSLKLFLKNSGKRKNGSRKPCFGDNIEYNDEYAMTEVESLKKLSCLIFMIFLIILSFTKVLN